MKSGTQSANVYVVLGRTSWNPKLNLAQVQPCSSEFGQAEAEEKETNKNHM